MRIVKAEVGVYRLSMELPVIRKRVADGTKVIVEIETDTGHHGFGITGRAMAHGVAASIEKELLPLIADMDVRDVEAIHARLWPAIGLRGLRTGVGMGALSCIDLALWDVAGKASGRSVTQMFGGARRDVGVYVTFGFGQLDEDQLVTLAKDLVAQGYRCLKVLVGVAKGGIVEDARRVRAVADAVGECARIALDANETLDYDHALRLCRMLDGLDIAFFEDPIRGNDARQLADLRRIGRVVVGVGQFDGYASRFREWLDADAVDIFMCNSMYNGGFTETRRVAALSQVHNKPLSDAGAGGLISLHHVAGFRNGTMLEMHLANAQLERDMYLETPEPVDGRLAVPDRPGIGLELNHDFLAEHCLSKGEIPLPRGGR